MLGLSDSRWLKTVSFRLFLCGQASGPTSNHVRSSLSPFQSCPCGWVVNSLGPGLELLEVSWCLPGRPFPLHSFLWTWALGLPLLRPAITLPVLFSPSAPFFSLCLLPLLPFLLPQGRQWSLGVKTAVPNLFSIRDRFCGRQFFPGPGVGNGFMMIQVNYIYCALYFY